MAKWLNSPYHVEVHEVEMKGKTLHHICHLGGPKLRGNENGYITPGMLGSITLFWGKGKKWGGFGQIWSYFLAFKLERGSLIGVNK